MYKVHGYMMFKGSTALTYCIRDNDGCLVADKIPTEAFANEVATSLNTTENIKEEN